MFHRTCVLWHYEGWIQSSLLKLKKHPHTSLIHCLSQHLTHALITHYQDDPWPPYAIAIPQHPQRTRKRGYHMCLTILQQAIKQLSHIEDQSHLIQRIYEQPHQHHLNKQKRQRASRLHHFACHHKLPEYIAVFDDVWTTGHTAQNFVTFCLKHGAKKVDFWCLAKQSLLPVSVEN